MRVVFALALAAVSAAYGVTFDFARISSERFHVPTPDESGNLAGAEPFVESDVNHAPWTKKVLARYVDLPDDRGGDYRLSFRYQMTHEGASKYGGDVMVEYFRRDAVGKRVPLGVKVYTLGDGTYHYWRLSDVWGTWAPFVTTVPVPTGAASMRVSVRVHDAGDVLAKDAGLVRRVAEKAEPVTLSLGAMSYLDGRFALAQGQAGVVCVEWKASVKERRWDYRKFLFTLSLPAGVEFLDAVIADPKTVRTVPTADGGTTVTFVPQKGRVEIDANKIWLHRQFGVLLKSSAAAGTELGPLTVALDYENARVAEPVSLGLFTVPPIRAAKPTRYRNGFYYSKYQAAFGRPGSDAAFAEAVSAAGATAAVGRHEALGAERIAAWRKAGVSFVLPETFSICQNAYWWADGAHAPAEDKFVTKGDLGRFGNYITKYGLCPKAIIEKRPFFMTNVVPKIRRALAGGNGMTVNWEPGMFRKRGCFCAKCSAELAAFKGKPEDYRSQEHAKMVRVLDEIAREATGGAVSAGFVPEISWREVCSSWRANDPSPETRPIDYGGDLSWLEAWGPYYGWDAKTPYLYEKRGPVVNFVAARDVREQVDKDFPKPQTPKLMAFPNGIQNSYVVQPEWLEMSLDAYFFNRWEAAVPYFFPDGYDARYWAAFARATDRAAKCERYVWDGKRADEAVSLVPVAEYARPCRTVTGYLPNRTDVSPLCSAAFDLDGARLVAVLNFWEKGEAFFDLKATGLVGSFVLTSEGKAYAKADGSRVYSAEELAVGVRLVVGAARTQVFEIVPAARAADLPVVTADEIAAQYAARRPELAKEAAADAAAESAGGGVKKNTLMEF